MKKTLIASAIAVSALSSINAQADIAITSMFFGTVTYAAGGSLQNSGNGSIYSIDPFFYHTWTGSQQTRFMDTSGSFAGSNAQGSWDYTADIRAMTSEQFAVGFFFNWNGYNEIALLEIFNCEIGGTVEDPGLFNCIGTDVDMQNGPFIGSRLIFSSGPIILPIPASAWLMVSGLVGLVGLSRRKA